ncbi:MAG: hypothetical protein ACE5ED_12745 [Rhodothalassiaceae bacterium]
MLWKRKQRKQDSLDLIQNEDVIAGVLAREGLRPDEITALLKRRRGQDCTSPEAMLLAARSVV